MEFSIGDRVRITDPSHWASGATGTIAEPPELARCVGPGWSAIAREMPGEDGPILMYWVQFDTAHYDEGEGPYDGAEVDVRFLEHLPEAA